MPKSRTHTPEELVEHAKPCCQVVFGTSTPHEADVNAYARKLEAVQQQDELVAQELERSAKEERQRELLAGQGDFTKVLEELIENADEAEKADYLREVLREYQSWMNVEYRQVRINVKLEWSLRMTPGQIAATRITSDEAFHQRFQCELEAITKGVTGSADTPLHAGYQRLLF